MYGCMAVVPIILVDSTVHTNDECIGLLQTLGLKLEREGSLNQLIDKSSFKRYVHLVM